MIADGSPIPLSTQHYAPDVVYPRGIECLSAFTTDPWPRWSFEQPDGQIALHDCVVDPVDGSTVLSWWIDSGSDACAPRAPAMSLSVSPLLSGRDYHALMPENAVFRNATWQPYGDQPAVAALS